MGDVRVQVNEQTYALSCADGEEDRVQALARYLDDHVQRWADQVGRSAESRLLMLAAISICDELFDARARLAGADPSAEAEEWSKAAEIAENIAARFGNHNQA